MTIPIETLKRLQREFDRAIDAVEQHRTALTDALNALDEAACGARKTTSKE